MINFIAVTPAGPGHLRAWAYSDPPVPPPLASILNYGVVTGLPALANAIVVPLCDPQLSLCDFDLTLQANASATHLVAAVVGYFAGLQGPPGPPGPPGPMGPTIRTSVVCRGETPGQSCSTACPGNLIGNAIVGPCRVTSDNGFCAVDAGTCCVCRN